MLSQAGYLAVGTTSLGVAGAVGKPDAKGAVREETLALTHRLARLPVLLTVDLESGFSDDPAEAADLAAEISAAGAVGINLEDGRADETLAPSDLHCAKISAIKSRSPELFVNARTDAFWLATKASQSALDESLQRARDYLSAGADGIFVPGLRDYQSVQTLSAEIAAPLNILYQPGRHTLSRLARAGAARVSTGSLLFRAALQVLVQTAHAARDDAVLEDSERPTYRQIQTALIGP
jgi:2-methylisocitrate lyase-like PEP mutase family enzyme